MTLWRFCNNRSHKISTIINPKQRILTPARRKRMYRTVEPNIKYYGVSWIRIWNSRISEIRTCWTPKL